MTRKDYVAIAQALATSGDNVLNTRTMTEQEKRQALLGVAVAVDNIATMLAADNPRFDRGRFIQAATFGGSK